MIPKAGVCIIWLGSWIYILSLCIGLGFTQCPEIFAHFPSIIRAVFAENCVALVFVTAVILNLFLPKLKSNN